MKRATIMTMLAMAMMFFMTGTAGAMEERNAYEIGDGNWIYFGPAPTDEWTTAREMPRKRSLEQSIRGDALRHYEMPGFKLPESGELLMFYDGTESRSAERGRNAESVNYRRPEPAESPWAVYELPESGGIIVFCDTNDPAGCV